VSAPSRSIGWASPSAHSGAHFQTTNWGWKIVTAARYPVVLVRLGMMLFRQPSHPRHKGCCCGEQYPAQGIGLERFEAPLSKT